jgi:hypothetical protein
MDEEARAHNESLLQIYTSHLRQLEIMAAKYGDLAVPSHVALEIAEYRRRIAELEAQLRAPALGARPRRVTTCRRVTTSNSLVAIRN